MVASNNNDFNPTHIGITSCFYVKKTNIDFDAFNGIEAIQKNSKEKILM